MNREEKLRLSADEEWGCGFRQGVFVRFFEQSLYHFCRSVRPLKPMQERSKEGKIILYGGLPIQSFERLLEQGILPAVENTDYGWRWPYSAQKTLPFDESMPDFAVWRETVGVIPKKSENNRTEKKILAELIDFDLAVHTPIQAVNAIAAWQKALRKDFAAVP